MRYRILLFCLSGLAAPMAVAAQESHSHSHSHSDSSFRAMQSRGKTAMGVDQYLSSHRFDPLPDGGRIQLESDAGDGPSVAAIRAHFDTLAIAFRAGRFDVPGFVHGEEVPGTKVMAAKRELISYRVEQTEKGGGLRISTKDRESVEAIHQFLAYQRSEHRVQR